MCTINSFVGYAIVKMKTSNTWSKQLDKRAYIYLEIDCSTQCYVSTEIVVNVNKPLVLIYVTPLMDSRS